MYTPTQEDLNTIKEVVNNNVDFNDAFLKELLVLYNGDINQVMEALLTGDYTKSKVSEISNNRNESSEKAHGIIESANDTTTPIIHIKSNKPPTKSQLNKNIQYTTINMFDETDVAKYNPANTPMFIVPKNCYNIGINYFSIFLYSIITNYTLPQDIVEMTLENSTHDPENNFVKFVKLYNAVKTNSNDKLFQDTQYYTVPSSLMNLDIEIPISETFSILIKSFINDYFILQKDIKATTSNSNDTVISESDPILNMLISTSSYYTTQQNVNNLYCMHFPQEEYTTNLNKMLNNLFLSADNYEFSQGETERGNDIDLQVEQSNRLLKVSDVFTVIFDQEEYDDDDDDDDDDMSMNRKDLIDVENSLVDVDIPVKFYPELYTTPVLKIIKREIAPQLNSIKAQINDLNVKLNMKLKYYQGAPVLSFLNTCLKYLSTEEDPENESDPNERRQQAIETLNIVKQNLSAAKLKIIDQINSLKQQLHDLDLNNLELSPTIVGLINKHQLTNLDESKLLMNEYKLVALIISSNNYFILNSKGKYTNYVVLNNTLNFNNTQVDDRMLHQLFKEYITTSKKEPIMCVYSKQGEEFATEDLVDMS